ncbi:hypothetical protein ACFWIP_19885, partial [Streptomyces anulatus]
GGGGGSAVRGGGAGGCGGGVIDEGVAAGLLPDQDAEITAAALTGAVGEVLVYPLSTSAAHDTDRLVTRLTAVALRCAGAAP